MKRRTKLICIMLVLMFAFTNIAAILPGASGEAHVENVGSFGQDYGELVVPGQEFTSVNTKGDLTVRELAVKTLSEADRPEAISKATITEKNHVHRLYEQEEDLKSVVFQNKDGTKTLYSFTDDVKYIDENGTVKDKTNLLSSAVDNPEYTKDYAYVNRDNDIKTYYPKILTESTGVVLDNGEIKLVMSPVLSGELKNTIKEKNNKTVNSESITATRTVEIKSDENIDYVDYENIFGSGTKLRYNSEFDGFKEDLILDRYTGQNIFEFTLQTNGLTLTEYKGAYYLLDPLTGEEKGRMGDLIVYDSSTSKNNNDYSHKYEIETIDENNEYRIKINIDEEYLLDETTVYPVIIDPTLTISSPTYTGSNYIQDVTLDYYDNNSTDYYSSPLYIGYRSDKPSTKGVSRILMKSSNLVANMSTIASANNITSAYLYIKHVDSDTINSGLTINSYRVTKSWEENTAKCSNMWDYYSSNSWYSDSITIKTGTGLSGIGASTSGQGNWYRFNVTNLVRGWKCGENNYGLMLKAFNESSNSTWAKIESSESSVYSNRPAFVINYNSSAPSPTCVELSSSSVQLNVGGTKTLTAVIGPTGANQGVTWSVIEGSNYISVDQNGKINAFGAGGPAKVRAYSKANSNVYATCTVNVGIGKSYANVSNGIYYIKNVHTGTYLDLTDGVVENYTNVKVYGDKGVNQQWYVEKQSDNTYKIMYNTNRHYNLDVDYGINENKRNIWLHSNNDSTAQRWKFINNGDGTYSIQPMMSETRVLDVDLNNNTNVELYDYRNTNNQKWVLVEKEVYKYGSIYHNNKEYPIDNPTLRDKEGPTISPVYEVVDEVIYSDLRFALTDDFDPELIEAPKVYAGYYNLNPQLSQPGLAHGSSLFMATLQFLNDNLYRFNVKFTFSEAPGGAKKVTIKAADTRNINTINTLANNQWVYSNLPGFFQPSLDAAYRDIMGNDPPTGYSADFRVRMDSGHKNNDGYMSYLWINSNGKIMETPVVLPNDRAELGHSTIFGINFTPVYVYTIDGSSEASPEYQNLFGQIY